MLERKKSERLISGDDSADQSDVDNNEKSHWKISRSTSSGSNQSESRYRTKSENLSEPVVVKRKSSHSPRNSFDRPVLPPPPPPKLNPQKEWFPRPSQTAPVYPSQSKTVSVRLGRRFVHVKIEYGTFRMCNKLEKWVTPPSLRTVRYVHIQYFVELIHPVFIWFYLFHPSYITIQDGTVEISQNFREI